MTCPSFLFSSFQSLSQEARELYLPKRVPVLQHVPTALEFHRDFVSRNIPVIIRGAFDHWPARHKWDCKYLREKIGRQQVTVAVTPNGYADAVCDSKFVMPEERMMTFEQFLDILERRMQAKGVFYVQKQNSNFTSEFKEVENDVDSDIPWATEAFGKPPDAINFWMGDERAVTSMHKDHYENLYCVVSGQKTFILIPPTDQAFIPYEQFTSAVYKENSHGKFDIVDVDPPETVPWITIDPLKPDLVHYPQYKHASPLSVTVSAGDTLYLPSLWYHHVQQTHACIAINFWYDMEFDIKYAYYKFIETLHRHDYEMTDAPPTDVQQ